MSLGYAVFRLGCHAHKRESIEKYEEVADENWQRFGEC